MTWTLLQSFAAGSPPLADGTALTISNTNLKTPTVGAGNSHVARTAARMGATDGFSQEQAGANTSFWYHDLAVPVTTKFALRYPMRYGATPAANIPFIRFFSDTGHTDNLGSLTLTTTHRMQFLEDSSGGGTPLNVTSPSGVGNVSAAATDYYGLLLIDLAANTFENRLYPKGSVSALHTISGTLGADMAGATQIASIRWGIAAASALVGSYLYTNSDYALGKDDWPTRTDITNTNPVMNAGVDRNVEPLSIVELDSSASVDPDVGDSIVSRVWTHISGPTSVAALDNDTAIKPKYLAGVYLTNQTDVWRVTGTDSFGGTHYDDVSITILKAQWKKRVAGAWVPAVLRKRVDGAWQ